MIHRQIFMMRGKRRRKGGGRERSEKDIVAFFCRIAGCIQPLLFSESPPSNHTPPVKLSSVIYIDKNK
ncbi:hypothetical protein [Aneurinibacillus migulanus]|uniref:hypothetical protein n=1 Tax=Aneurinibacillus migulanus TaxID=47500 RepID=UPI001F3B74EC|nr:hypothetical protein [Aneurinibacillus migulanus]